MGVVWVMQSLIALLMVPLVGVVYATVQVREVGDASADGEVDGSAGHGVTGGVGGNGAPGGVGDAEGEGGGSGGAGEGAAGNVAGSGVAGDADGEGAVPGLRGCNVSGPDRWTWFVVLVVRVL